MFARLTLTIRADENTTEQSTAIVDIDNISLEDFRYTVEDTFGSKFISNIQHLFSKIETRIQERENTKQLTAAPADKPEPVVDATNTNDEPDNEPREPDDQPMQ